MSGGHVVLPHRSGSRRKAVVFPRTRCHVELLPPGVGSLWLVPGCGLAGQWVCRHSSGFLGLGNRSYWAQGHSELAQGPLLRHSVEPKKTDPFLRLLTEGSRLGF